MRRLGEIPLMREIHILDGDGNGIDGGHRGDSEIPGKTKFPRDWDDDRILSAITDVVRAPDEAPTARTHGGWICEVTRDGVTIRVVINRDGDVWTAHPLSGPGVETNPR
jgi:hypothetical protein